MHIIELKSQNVKILYKPSEYQLKVGDFVSFADGELTLIAQIFKITSSPAADDYNQADLFFVLSHKYDKTQLWNGEIISMEAQANIADKNIVENHIYKTNIGKMINIGKYAAFSNTILRLNADNFKTPAFIGFEKNADNINLVQTLAAQLSNNDKDVLAMDFKGNLSIDGAKKILAGVQAKLPLNADILENLCPKILEGVSLENKIVIEDIILEVAQYAKESANGFIPLAHFIKVIDDIYQKSKISQLILLKNKLRQYQRLNIFANTKEEVYAVFSAMAQAKSVIFDVSNIPNEWQKEFLAELLKLNKTLKKEFFLFVTLDEQNFNNTIINNLLFKAQNIGISPIISANYRHMSFENIFDFSQNTFLFKTYNALTKHKTICEILQSLPQENLIITGRLTNSLLICTKLRETNEPLPVETFQEKDIQKFEEKQTTTDLEQIQAANSITTPITNIDMNVLNTAFQPEPSIKLQAPQNILTENTNMETIQDISPQANEQNFEEVLSINENEADIKEIEPEIQEIQPEIIPEENSEPIEKEEEKEEAQTSEIIDLVQSEDELPKQNTNVIEPAANIFEEVPAETQDIEDIPDENPQEEILESSQEIEDINIDDLDFLNETQNIEAPQASSETDDDDLLDLLENNPESSQEIVMSNEEAEPTIEDIDLDDLDFSEEASEVQPNTEPPMQKLPIYNADYSTEEKQKTNFMEGDLVKHQKYGVGTIKKITAHGDKVLCHINFDDFGRRLLDPDISQLEKL